MNSSATKKPSNASPALTGTGFSCSSKNISIAYKFFNFLSSILFWLKFLQEYKFYSLIFYLRNVHIVILLLHCTNSYFRNEDFNRTPIFFYGALRLDLSLYPQVCCVYSWLQCYPKTVTSSAVKNI